MYAYYLCNRNALTRLYGVRSTEYRLMKSMSPDKKLLLPRRLVVFNNINIAILLGFSSWQWMGQLLGTPSPKKMRCGCRNDPSPRAQSSPIGPRSGGQTHKHSSRVATYLNIQPDYQLCLGCSASQLIRMRDEQTATLTEAAKPCDAGRQSCVTRCNPPLGTISPASVIARLRGVRCFALVAYGVLRPC